MYRILATFILCAIAVNPCYSVRERHPCEVTKDWSKAQITIPVMNSQQKKGFIINQKDLVFTANGDFFAPVSNRLIKVKSITTNSFLSLKPDVAQKDTEVLTWAWNQESGLELCRQLSDAQNGSPAHKMASINALDMGLEIEANKPSAQPSVDALPEGARAALDSAPIYMIDVMEEQEGSQVPNLRATAMKLIGITSNMDEHLIIGVTEERRILMVSEEGFPSEEEARKELIRAKRDESEDVATKMADSLSYMRKKFPSGKALIVREASDQLRTWTMLHALRNAEKEPKESIAYSDYTVSDLQPIASFSAAKALVSSAATAKGDGTSSDTSKLDDQKTKTDTKTSTSDRIGSGDKSAKDAPKGLKKKSDGMVCDQKIVKFSLPNINAPGTDQPQITTRDLYCDSNGKIYLEFGGRLIAVTKGNGPDELNIVSDGNVVWAWQPDTEEGPTVSGDVDKRLVLCVKNGDKYTPTTESAIDHGLETTSSKLVGPYVTPAKAPQQDSKNNSVKSATTLVKLGKAASWGGIGAGVLGSAYALQQLGAHARAKHLASILDDQDSCQQWIKTRDAAHARMLLFGGASLIAIVAGTAFLIANRDQ